MLLQAGSLEFDHSLTDLKAKAVNVQVFGKKPANK